MSEIINYETYLPELKGSEWYVVEGDGGSYTVLMLTGEVLKNVIICGLKETVERIVKKKGYKYIGIGYYHDF